MDSQHDSGNNYFTKITRKLTETTGKLLENSNSTTKTVVGGITRKVTETTEKLLENSHSTTKTVVGEITRKVTETTEKLLENSHCTTKNVVEGIVKGEKAYQLYNGWRYAIRRYSSKACAVSIVDTTVKGPKWVARFDRAHNNVNFNHININPKISGVPDPHIPLPPGGLQAAKGISKLCKIVNDITLPIAITLDAYYLGTAVYKDYQSNSVQNTLHAAANITGAWGGAYGGAVVGTTIGTMIFPGIGTMFGGLVGGICGGVGGVYGTTKLTNSITDKMKQD